MTDILLESSLRHDGHGVNVGAIRNAVKKPLQTVQQANGAIKYVGKNTVVVLTKVGKVVTTYAKNHQGWRYLVVLWLGSKLTQEK